MDTLEQWVTFRRIFDKNSKTDRLYSRTTKLATSTSDFLQITILIEANDK